MSVVILDAQGCSSSCDPAQHGQQQRSNSSAELGLPCPAGVPAPHCPAGVPAPHACNMFPSSLSPAFCNCGCDCQCTAPACQESALFLMHGFSVTVPRLLHGWCLLASKTSVTKYLHSASVRILWTVTPQAEARARAKVQTPCIALALFAHCTVHHALLVTAKHRRGQGQRAMAHKACSSICYVVMARRMKTV